MTNKFSIWYIWFLIQGTQNENCFETFGSLCSMIFGSFSDWGLHPERYLGTCLFLDSRVDLYLWSDFQLRWTSVGPMAFRQTLRVGSTLEMKSPLFTWIKNASLIGIIPPFLTWPWTNFIFSQTYLSIWNCSPGNVRRHPAASRRAAPANAA